MAQQQRRRRPFRTGQRQAAAGGEIGRADLADNGGQGGGAQAFLHRPQHLLVAIDGDHDQPVRIDTQRGQAGAVQPAEFPRHLAVLAPQNGARPTRSLLQAAQQSQAKAKGGRPVAIGFGSDIVQAGSGQPPVRQGIVDGLKAETPCRCTSNRNTCLSVGYFPVRWRGGRPGAIILRWPAFDRCDLVAQIVQHRPLQGWFDGRIA